MKLGGVGARRTTCISGTNSTARCSDCRRGICYMAWQHVLKDTTSIVEVDGGER